MLMIFPTENTNEIMNHKQWTRGCFYFIFGIYVFGLIE